jgi:hypothetical protein
MLGQSQKESAEALPQIWTLELFHLLASIDIFHLSFHQHHHT